MGGSGMEVVSNVLSAVTIISCLFMKVPQINAIKRLRCANGIHIYSLVMEIVGFTVMTLYNFMNGYNPMTYLEYPIILLQVYVMFYYVVKYQNKLQDPILSKVVLAYFVTVCAFLLGILPEVLISYLVPFCTPLSGFAKVSYIHGIMKEQSSNAVSLTTWIISIATNIIRVFTVHVDSGDIKLLFNFIVSTFLSCAVLFTAIYYRTKPDGSPEFRLAQIMRKALGQPQNDAVNYKVK